MASSGSSSAMRSRWPTNAGWITGCPSGAARAFAKDMRRLDDRPFGPSVGHPRRTQHVGDRLIGPACEATASTVLRSPNTLRLGRGKVFTKPYCGARTGARSQLDDSYRMGDCEEVGAATLERSIRSSRLLWAARFDVTVNDGGEWAPPRYQGCGGRRPQLAATAPTSP